MLPASLVKKKEKSRKSNVKSLSLSPDWELMILYPAATLTSDLLYDPSPLFLHANMLVKERHKPATDAFCLQVTASDQDGPSNSLLRYSIVSGDPLQQFSIHPRSGEISVTAALDREEVCLRPGSLIPHHRPVAEAHLSLLSRCLTTR